MQYDKELIAHKLDRWDPVHHRLPPAGVGRHPRSGAVYGPGGGAAGPVSELHPGHARRQGKLCHLLHHQQLCAAEDHARPGKAEILPGPHRLSHHDPDHEAEHQHQRRAEDHPGRTSPRRTSGPSIRSIPRNSATLPCFSTNRSRTRRRISARRTSPARPPYPGWSSKAP